SGTDPQSSVALFVSGSIITKDKILAAKSIQSQDVVIGQAGGSFPGGISTSPGSASVLDQLSLTNTLLLSGSNLIKAFGGSAGNKLTISGSTIYITGSNLIISNDITINDGTLHFAIPSSDTELFLKRVNPALVSQGGPG